MKKRVLALLLVLTMVFALTACGGSETSETPAEKESAGSSAAAGNTENAGSAETAAKRNDVNIYCEGVFGTLDPHGAGAITYTNQYLASQIYEPLVKVEEDGSVTPILAEDWEISEDGLTYTFNIRQGVKFHNGEELKASDAAYSINRAMEMGILVTYYQNIASAEAVDDYVLVVTLTAPFAPQLSYFYDIPIVNEKFAESSDMVTTACGTGPYELVDIDFNLECNLKAFADYWQGKAAIETAKIKVITEATTAAVAFESGELDFFFCYNTSAYAPLAESGKYNTELVAQQHTALILLNNAVAPLDDVRVRQALSHATDRETMIAIAYDGLAAPTYLMANPTSFGVTEENFYNRFEYDLDKAKALLAEAGYPDGLDLGDMTVIGGSYHEKYAQVWQQSLAQIGVTVNLVASESAVADTVAHEYVTATMGESFTPDFAYAASTYYTGGEKNKTMYENPEVTEMINKAAASTDSEERLALYNDIINIVAEDATCIPIFNKQVPWVWNKDLNANPRNNGGHPYYIYEMSWN